MVEKVYYQMFPDKIDNITNILNNLNQEKKIRGI